MRIDEFSAPSDIDGVMGTKEQRRFLLFGFDIQSVIPISFYEEVFINSPLCVEKILYCPVCLEKSVHTPIHVERLLYSSALIQIKVDSLITTTIVLN